MWRNVKGRCQEFEVYTRKIEWLIMQGSRGAQPPVSAGSLVSLGNHRWNGSVPKGNRPERGHVAYGQWTPPGYEYDMFVAVQLAHRV
jgi:hypothetical protein